MSHTFGNYTMHTGKDRSLYSGVVIEAIMQAGKLQNCRIDHVETQPLADEEVGLAAMHPDLGSTSLVRPRIPVVGAFQALVQDAFQRHSIPTRGEGLDIGSGASGYMVKNLLPEEAQQRWMQMELSPAAAQMNRDANPGKTVITASYLRLQEQGLTNMFDAISGLSSLDATAHIDHAIEEIRAALKVGGILIHVQDTRPGITLAHQELQHMGAQSPYDALYLDDAKALQNRAVIYRHGLQTVDVIELFRRRLGRAISANSGFELHENTWMTAVGPGTKSGMNQHSELGVFVGLESTKPIDTASAVITVAKKIK